MLQFSTQPLDKTLKDKNFKNKNRFGYGHMET